MYYFKVLFSKLWFWNVWKIGQIIGRTNCALLTLLEYLYNVKHHFSSHKQPCLHPFRNWLRALSPIVSVSQNSNDSFTVFLHLYLLSCLHIELAYRFGWEPVESKQCDIIEKICCPTGHSYSEPSEPTFSYHGTEELLKATLKFVHYILP